MKQSIIQILKGPLLEKNIADLINLMKNEDTYVNVQNKIPPRLRK